jgi:hypothetical protein
MSSCSASIDSFQKRCRCCQLSCLYSHPALLCAWFRELPVSHALYTPTVRKGSKRWTKLTFPSLQGFVAIVNTNCPHTFVSAPGSWGMVEPGSPCQNCKAVTGPQSTCLYRWGRLLPVPIVLWEEQRLPRSRGSCHGPSLPPSPTPLPPSQSEP